MTGPFVDEQLRQGCGAAPVFKRDSPIPVRKLTVQLRKIHAGARLPRYAHGANEDAGMDLHALRRVEIAAGEWAGIATGLAIELPPGLEGQVRPRSGLAERYGLTLLNTPGTIDPGYRGEIRVLLINHGRESYTVEPGDRIAQLVIAAYAEIEWNVSEDLAGSNRGIDGFGSTGQ